MPQEQEVAESTQSALPEVSSLADRWYQSLLAGELPGGESCAAIERGLESRKAATRGAAEDVLTRVLFQLAPRRGDRQKLDAETFEKRSSLTDWAWKCLINSPLADDIRNCSGWRRFANKEGVDAIDLAISTLFISSSEKAHPEGRKVRSPLSTILAEALRIDAERRKRDRVRRARRAARLLPPQARRAAASLEERAEELRSEVARRIDSVSQAVTTFLVGRAEECERLREESRKNEARERERWEREDREKEGAKIRLGVEVLEPIEKCTAADRIIFLVREGILPDRLPSRLVNQWCKQAGLTKSALEALVATPRTEQYAKLADHLRLTEAACRQRWSRLDRAGVPQAVLERGKAWRLGRR